MDISNYNLGRFVKAQEPVLSKARRELKAGLKQSHWMWFIFPQLEALGKSPMAKHYGISTIDEARAYLAHGLLGPRLVEMTELAIAHRGKTLRAIFGSPDDLKFCSSMTLFSAASNGAEIFDDALYCFCQGQRHGKTLDILNQAPTG
ncbi:DUF1810 domain-containing protein [Phyllobacterium sp. 22552]|uniref:DUF1810 domain-containing protein n=1 Tax=Phyllobacterium sp. 22552 TaxID=3453941 RepID=UPI003F86546C